MTRIFSADTKKLKRRYNRILFLLNILPLSVTATLLIMTPLNQSSVQPPDFYRTLLRVLTLCTGYSFLTVGIGSAASEHCLRMHRRYTYLEIHGGDLIIARYAGREFRFGRNRDAVYQKLWISSLREMEEVVAEESGRHVTVSAPTRAYQGQALWLRIRGTPEGASLDCWWYQENGFRKENSVEIPDFFRDREQIAEVILRAAEAVRKKDEERNAFRQRMLSIAAARAKGGTSSRSRTRGGRPGGRR